MGLSMILSGGNKKKRMGISSSCCCGNKTCQDSKPKDINPDPYYCTIRRSLRVGNVMVLNVYYPNCTNYEGNKILVMRGRRRPRLPIDPHFYEGSNLIARFHPTRWDLAVRFARIYNKKER